MPQISRRRLPKEIEEKIKASFYEAVSAVKGDREVALFLRDLLTPTERVMIPKRLAIAILISKGWNNMRICSHLNVTNSTVASVVKAFESSSGFKAVINKLQKNEAWRSLWQDIESLLYRFSAPGRGFIEEDVIRRKLRLKKKTLV